MLKRFSCLLDYMYSAISCKIPHTKRYNPIAHLRSFGKTKTRSPSIIARAADIVRVIATIDDSGRYG